MLCMFARQFPPFVASFLDQGRRLKRRFREESVTDLLMCGLATNGGARIFVEFPDEPATGADMEWNFANISDNTFYRILIQAKQAYGAGGDWTKYSYKELFHRSGFRGPFQAEKLCDTAYSASATYPLYAFYHPGELCTAANAVNGRTLEGVNLADGYVVGGIVAGATTRKMTAQRKKIDTFRPFLFSLSDLLCPDFLLPAPILAYSGATLNIPLALGLVNGKIGLGQPIPPRPIEIRARLEGLISAIHEKFPDWPELPPIGTDLLPCMPSFMRRVCSGYAPRWDGLRTRSV